MAIKLSKPKKEGNPQNGFDIVSTEENYDLDDLKKELSRTNGSELNTKVSDEYSKKEGSLSIKNEERIIKTTFGDCNKYLTQYSPNALNDKYITQSIIHDSELRRCYITEMFDNDLSVVNKLYVDQKDESLKDELSAKIELDKTEVTNIIKLINERLTLEENTRAEKDSYLENLIAEEAKKRESEDEKLLEKIKDIHIDDVTGLKNKLYEEIEDRIDGDNLLNTSILKLKNTIDSEINTLKKADTELNSEISNLTNSKQDNLVSGTNIKTIDNKSILGPGNLEIVNTKLLKYVGDAIQLGDEEKTLNINTKNLDIRVNSYKYVALMEEYPGDPTRKALVLNNHDTITGTSTTGDGAPLIMMSKWDVVDVGSNRYKTNINAKDYLVTVNDDSHIVLSKNLPGNENEILIYAADGTVKSSSVTLENIRTEIASVVNKVKIGENEYSPISGIVTLPEYPVVNDSIVNITQNGSSKGSFTLNKAAETTITLTNVNSSEDGLMSKEDKNKLDLIEDNANNYELPSATSDTLGGIKVGSDFDITSDGLLTLYKTISINNFTNNINTVEIGRTITDVTLSWVINKIPETLQLDGETLEKTETSKILTGQSITSNKTFRLIAIDARGARSERTTAITFLNNMLYGVGTDYVETNMTKRLTSSKTYTFTVNAGESQFIYYAIPKRFGTPTFFVGGFEGGFDLLKEYEWTNGSGHSETYLVYKSTNASLGSTKVEVK